LLLSYNIFAIYRLDIVVLCEYFFSLFLFPSAREDRQKKERKEKSKGF